MKCGLCGAANSAEAGYCNQCGVMLGKKCPGCGAGNHPRALRCGACGTTLSGNPSRPSPPSRAPRESRRIVTVLFADIVGYTTMVESYSGRTEEVRALLQKCFDSLADVVVEHGGTIEKFIGDAICALFGAPMVHEDDPDRALRCALQMQRALTWLNRTDGEEDDPLPPLTLRIGISSGEVIGGTAERGGEAQYSVTGDAVNTASRLQSMAEAGQILVSGYTERLTRNQFVFESKGEIKLKGKRQPVATFLLTSERQGESEDAVPLIDRRRELQHLEYCLTLAREADPQLVEIVGDAGVGKTKLISTFASESAQTAVVCWGSSPQTVTGALFAFQSIAASLLQSLSEEGAESSRASQRTEMLNLLAAGDVTDVEDSIEPICSALHWAVEQISRREPVIIILENVHRADPATIELVRRLVSTTGNQRLLFIWTRRTGEEMIVEGDQQASLTRITLRPLSEADAEELLNHLLGPRDIPDRLRNLIVTRSGGNPLYLEAMVQTFLEEGGIPEGGLEGTGEIPATVQGLIQARLDSVSEQERLLTQEAAVVGREFQADLLQRVDLFGLDVPATLDRLIRIGLIEHLGGSLYRFRHVLTQEVAYEMMLQGLRAELHREVAEAILEAAGEDISSVAPSVADHFAKAGDTDRAVEILIQAGQPV